MTLDDPYSVVFLTFVIAILGIGVRAWRKRDRRVEF